MSGSGPKILILGEPTRFPAFARLGVGLWLRVERQRIPITRKVLEAGRLNDITCASCEIHSLGFPRSRPGSGSKRLRGLRPSRTYFGSPSREVAAILAVRPVWS